jgi:hypothetical protein
MFDPVANIEALEAEWGYQRIRPRWVAWRDWLECLMTLDLGRNEVRIILIAAKRPGRGAFRRLIAAIHANGFRPAVIAPFPMMEAILLHWGWHGERQLGDRIWRP